MVKRIIVLLCVIVFGVVGCEVTPQKQNWEKALVNYRCTVEEMARVNMETEACKTLTTFESSYCYGSAMIRICRQAEEYTLDQLDKELENAERTKR